MKKILIGVLFLGILFITSCEKRVPPVDIEAEKANINSVLENYVKSVENEDMNLYAQTMAHDSEMVNFGSSGEPIIGWDALKKAIEGQNAALSETKIDVSDMKIHVGEDGKFGWATCLWNFQAKIGENAIKLPVRCTWILEKRENRWIIVRFHKSVATTE
jgi:uncharacterized protein (TIGR02246 family)